MKKLFLVVLATLLLLASCEEAGKINYDSLEMIEWKGNFSEAPVDPEKGWMYYNTVECVTYLFDGLNWKIVSKDTQHVSITIDGKEFIGTYYFPFDGEIVVTKTVTITNTGTIDVFFDEDGPVIDSEDNAFCSKAEIVAPSWKSCLKPKESQSFTVRFIRDEKTLFDRAYVEILDASGKTSGGFLLESDNYSTLFSSPILIGYRKCFSSNLCHEIESSYFSIPKEIDFGNNPPNNIFDGITVELEIYNNTDEIITFTDKPLAYLDAEDENSFYLYAPEDGNVALYPKESMPILIMFAPTSLGEKTATLHIKQGNSSEDTIDINLHGNSTNKLFEGFDYIPTNITIRDVFPDTKVLLAGKEDSDSFFVCKNYSIREYSSEGELLESYDLPFGFDFDKLIHRNGKLYLYSSEPYCYSIFDPDSGELEEKEVACSRQEYCEAVGKDIDSDYGYIQRRLVYKDYYLDFQRLYPGIMFITKGEERVGAVVGRIDYDDQLDYCTSGDYLYWAEDCYVKRINIQEILDSLGL